jgi:hypothetical protein
MLLYVLQFLMHRDLKLSNILLTDKGILKIADMVPWNKCFPCSLGLYLAHVHSCDHRGYRD